MKPSILSLSTAGAALCLSLLSAPANAWWFFKKPEKNPEVTITETVLKSGGEFDTNYGDFDILLNAVTTAGLADALADPNASLIDNAPKLQDPSLNLKQGDILTSNGLIHLITRVLIPVDIP